jgi:hypothetical protein
MSSELEKVMKPNRIYTVDELMSQLNHLDTHEKVSQLNHLDTHEKVLSALVSMSYDHHGLAELSDGTWTMREWDTVDSEEDVVSEPCEDFPVMCDDVTEHVGSYHQAIDLSDLTFNVPQTRVDEHVSTEHIVSTIVRPNVQNPGPVDIVDTVAVVDPETDTDSDCESNSDNDSDITDGVVTPKPYRFGTNVVEQDMSAEIILNCIREFTDTRSQELPNVIRDIYDSKGKAIDMSYIFVRDIRNGVTKGRLRSQMEEEINKTHDTMMVDVLQAVSTLSHAGPHTIMDIPRRHRGKYMMSKEGPSKPTICDRGVYFVLLAAVGISIGIAGGLL